MNYFLLFLVTAIWGMGFIATKWTLTEFSALWSNTWRFLLAATIALPFAIGFRSYQIGWAKWRGVLLASFFLFLGMLLQTMGLVYTTAAKSGFITCLYSLLIPLFLVFTGKRFPLLFWFVLLQSLLGVALLCDLQWEAINTGDWLTFLCAFAFAGHFLVIDRIAKDFPSAVELNSLQCIGVALFSLPTALYLEGFPGFGSMLEFSGFRFDSPLSGFLLLSFFSSFVAFGVLAHTQKFLPAHSVATICLLESPFAALFGYWFLDERLSGMNLLGACLVLLSVMCMPFLDSLSRQCGRAFAILRAIPIPGFGHFKMQKKFFANKI